MWSLTCGQVKTIVNQRHHNAFPLMSPWRTAEPLIVGTSCCVISFLTLQAMYQVLCLLHACIQSESVSLVRKFPPLPAAEVMNHFAKSMKVGFNLQGSKNLAWVAGIFFLLHSIAMRWMLVIENISHIKISNDEWKSECDGFQMFLHSKESSWFLYCVMSHRPTSLPG